MLFKNLYRSSQQCTHFLLTYSLSQSRNDGIGISDSRFQNMSENCDSSISQLLDVGPCTSFLVTTVLRPFRKLYPLGWSLLPFYIYSSIWKTNFPDSLDSVNVQDNTLLCALQCITKKPRMMSGWLASHLYSESVWSDAQSSHESTKIWICWYILNDMIFLKLHLIELLKQSNSLSISYINSAA